jgi:hypothetical protein
MRCLVLLLALNAALAAQPIECDVVDSLTGDPIAGAYAVAWTFAAGSGMQNIVGVTDPTGYLHLPDIPWPRGAIQIYRAGYVLQVTFTMGVDVPGKVLDAAGRPAANMPISLIAAQGWLSAAPVRVVAGPNPPLLLRLPDVRQ